MSSEVGIINIDSGGYLFTKKDEVFNSVKLLA